jgi:transcriptional regulator with XRE-family HTH domain
MALAEARVDGRPQWRVSADAGIDPSVFSRILRGKFEPSQAQVEAIAASLGRPVTDLFPEHGGGP